MYKINLSVENLSSANLDINGYVSNQQYRSGKKLYRSQSMLSTDDIEYTPRQKNNLVIKNQLQLQKLHETKLEHLNSQLNKNVCISQHKTQNISSKLIETFNVANYDNIISNDSNICFITTLNEKSKTMFRRVNSMPAAGNKNSSENLTQVVENQSLQAMPSIPSKTESTINVSPNTLNKKGCEVCCSFHDLNLNHHKIYYTNTTMTNKSSNGSIDKIGSTRKLIPFSDEQPSVQSKCSTFRNLVLCICLNVTYGNIVRLPRELDRYGLQFLIPYLLMLFLVGFPLMLLEIAIGQFLGQDAANTWRSSPILKGACIISRLASWLTTLWISSQAVIAAMYAGMLLFKSIPFNNCVQKLRIFEEEGYKVLALSGQQCIQNTFLTPVWIDSVYYGFLVILLLMFWMIIMFLTHSGKIFRRMTLIFGLIGFGLLITLTSWEVKISVHSKYFPILWPFNLTSLTTCNLWFNALVQVIYSTNIGFGILPVVTGKFLYKADAVKISAIYLCFNLLINTISVTFYMVQFDKHIINEISSIPQLKPLTTIYDKLLEAYSNSDVNSTDRLITDFTSSLIFALLIISACVSVATAIYTSSRLVPKHPTYAMCFVALSATIAAFVCPKYKIFRILDSRIVGSLVISALIFDVIATIWIYGKKNIYTDLEFSIGRPIFKGWLYLWILAPVIPTGILVWWCVGEDENDVFNQFSPRWAPIAFVLFMVLLMAVIEIFRQVDYNIFGMICEAAKPAKEWGPVDPLARHAWKQWRSISQDTGRKDFTLRRRGTRDYTHSIKTGKYSTNDNNLKLFTPNSNWKSVSTRGTNSPNYSVSVFDDTAIEEDMSLDKYFNLNQKLFQQNHLDTKVTSRILSNRCEKTSHDLHKYHSNHDLSYSTRVPEKLYDENQYQSMQNSIQHEDIVYTKKLPTNRMPPNHSTRIEITPSNEAITYAITKNSIKRKSNVTTAQNKTREMESSFNVYENISNKEKKINSDFDHICWREFSVNSDEYSTEL